MNSESEEEKRVIEPEVVGQSDDASGQPEPLDDEVPATGLMRAVWIVVAVVCGVYIFIPEFTDVIPFIGWPAADLTLIHPHILAFVETGVQLLGTHGLGGDQALLFPLGQPAGHLADDAHDVEHAARDAHRQKDQR